MPRINCSKNFIFYYEKPKAKNCFKALLFGKCVTKAAVYLDGWLFA